MQFIPFLSLLVPFFQVLVSGRPLPQIEGNVIASTTAMDLAQTVGPAPVIESTAVNDSTTTSINGTSPVADQASLTAALEADLTTPSKGGVFNDFNVGRNSIPSVDSGAPVARLPRNGRSKRSGECSVAFLISSSYIRTRICISPL